MTPDPHVAMAGPGTPHLPDRTLDFVLVGQRPYVRATDVLRQLIAQFPDQEILLRFVAPLTGAALLSSKRPDRPSIFAEIGGDRVYLTNLQGATPPRRVTGTNTTSGCLRLRLGRTYLFAFGRGGSVSDRIERCFDLVHPELGHVFVVRAIRVVAGPARKSRLLWFRILRDGDRGLARLTMRTRRGVLADIRFQITPRPEHAQSTATESPQPEGSARSSSATADVDRRDPEAG